MQQSRSPDVVDDQLYVCACVCVRILCACVRVSRTHTRTHKHTQTHAHAILFTLAAEMPRAPSKDTERRLVLTFCINSTRA